MNLPWGPAAGQASVRGLGWLLEAPGKCGKKEARKVIFALLNTVLRRQASASLFLL